MTDQEEPKIKKYPVVVQIENSPTRSEKIDLLAKERERLREQSAVFVDKAERALFGVAAIEEKE